MKILFCDLNGTVLDDVPVWEKAMRAMFLIENKEPPTISEYFAEYDGDYLAPYRTRGVTTPTEELNAIYRRVYAEHMESVQMFAGVKKTLKELRERGVLLALLTGQEMNLAIPVLERLNMYHYFHWKLFQVRDKSKEMGNVICLANAKRKAGDEIKISDCWSIGDSPFDIREAKRAGVTSVSFLTGCIASELLIRERPDFAIMSFKNLTRLR